MAAPIGNTNATKSRPWRAAIDRAIAQSDPDRLRSLAEKLIKKAEEGDLSAIKELGDRLDGKPSQQIDLGNAGGVPFIVKIDASEKDL